jgi:hypothetical protein
MTTKQIHFSIERWKEGLKPVTRDGREVKQLVCFDNLDSAYVLAGVVGSDLVRWKLEGGSSWQDNYSLMLLEEVREPREFIIYCDPRSGMYSTYFEPGWKTTKVREVLE